ncbi:hypothetical protein ACFLXY_09265 [Chloroflexota bacterium]
MNRINGKIKTALIASAALVIISSGAVTYGFQGILAALGLLFLLVSAGLGIIIMRKARLYAKALKHAEYVDNMDANPVSTDDKKWIIKHLDELFKTEEVIITPVTAPITKKDREQIMNHLDEFLVETLEYHTVTREDQIFIMDNINSLFEDNREEDRQTFTW